MFLVPCIAWSSAAIENVRYFDPRLLWKKYFNKPYHFSVEEFHKMQICNSNHQQYRYLWGSNLEPSIVPWAGYKPAYKEWNIKKNHNMQIKSMQKLHTLHWKHPDGSNDPPLSVLTAVHHPCPHKGIHWINSLWPSDAIWRYRAESTLAQVMACCLTASSHYLKQCWLIITEVQWHSC